jgi:hypothetical protein
MAVLSALSLAHRRHTKLIPVHTWSCVSHGLNYPGTTFLWALLFVMNSTVTDTTGWTTGIEFPAGARDFIYAAVSRPALGPTQPPIQWIRGAEPEVDHSPLSSAEVKNDGTVPPLPVRLRHLVVS